MLHWWVLVHLWPRRRRRRRMMKRREVDVVKLLTRRRYHRSTYIHVMEFYFISKPTLFENYLTTPE
jgi:hypothetical protein